MGSASLASNGATSKQPAIGSPIALRHILKARTHCFILARSLCVAVTKIRRPVDLVRPDLECSTCGRPRSFGRSKEHSS